MRVNRSSKARRINDFNTKRKQKQRAQAQHAKRLLIPTVNQAPEVDAVLDIKHHPLDHKQFHSLIAATSAPNSSGDDTRRQTRFMRDDLKDFVLSSLSLIFTIHFLARIPRILRKAHTFNKFDLLILAWNMFSLVKFLYHSSPNLPALTASMLMNSDPTPPQTAASDAKIVSISSSRRDMRSPQDFRDWIQYQYQQWLLMNARRFNRDLFSAVSTLSGGFTYLSTLSGSGLQFVDFTNILDLNWQATFGEDMKTDPLSAIATATAAITAAAELVSEDIFGDAKPDLATSLIALDNGDSAATAAAAQTSNDDFFNDDRNSSPDLSISMMVMDRRNPTSAEAAAGAAGSGSGSGSGSKVNTTENPNSKDRKQTASPLTGAGSAALLAAAKKPDTAAAVTTAAVASTNDVDADDLENDEWVVLPKTPSS